MNKLFAAVAVSGSMLAFQASAASVDITNIVGTWLSTVPAVASGVGTPSIRWGDPATNAGQSGYDFLAASTPINGVAADTAFDLGVFTHLNNPIFDPSITGATLQLLISISIDGGPIQQILSSYSFAHVETPNGANPCFDGGQNGVGVNVNGCADRVTATINLGQTQSFFVGLDEYVFTIDRFRVGSDAFSQFFTQEGANNSATLEGSYQLKSAVVPLPAAGWLMLAGIGALVAVRRRKAA
jgi:hypothetical protein